LKDYFKSWSPFTARLFCPTTGDSCHRPDVTAVNTQDHPDHQDDEEHRPGLEIAPMMAAKNKLPLKSPRLTCSEHSSLFLLSPADLRLNLFPV